MAKKHPEFIIQHMVNDFGQPGPVLCWVDGTIVGAQAETTLTLPADGISSITVKFHIGTGVVENRIPTVERKDG